MGDGTGPILVLTPDMVDAPVDDGVAHVTCTSCWPNYATDPHKSMCGFWLPANNGAPRKTGERCVVCLDMYDKPCPICGLI
jgi:hypothetical protein